MAGVGMVLTVGIFLLTCAWLCEQADS